MLKKKEVGYFLYDYFDKFRRKSNNLNNLLKTACELAWNKKNLRWTTLGTTFMGH